MSEACRTGQPVHILDWDEVPDDTFRDTAMRSYGRRSALSLPLLRNHEAVGVINATKVEPGGFSDDEMSLPPGVRRPGRDRRRQRTTPPRDRAAQPRTLRVARPPDRDQRSAATHQRQPWRPRRWCSRGSSTGPPRSVTPTPGQLWLKRGDELTCEAEVRGQVVSYVGESGRPSQERLQRQSHGADEPILTDDICAAVIP